MNDLEKLSNLKTILGITDTAQDALLGVYLSLAAAEIISWSGAGEFPAKYDVTQIMAVIAGYNLQGAEGQTSHSENGISRQWKHEDMVAYIRNHVIPYAVVL